MRAFRSFLFNFYIIIAASFFAISSANAGDVTSVDVGLHQSEVITLPSAMTNVIIADRGIAGVVKHSGQKVSIIGHGIGRTDIRFMSGKRIVRQVNVNVHQNLVEIKKSLNMFFPNEEIGVKMVNGAVALTGSVSSAENAGQIVQIVEEYLGNSGRVLNLMKMKSGQQVMLRVRVGELKREQLQKLGLGLHGVISSGSAVFGALEKEGLFKVLAEPTLTAISGETAQFLAGGEFPVPVSQGGNALAVDYKSFGVSVDFTPLVLSDNRIRLDVASEVSELGEKTSLKLPTIATRRANTTVELAPGESFMIAGLIQDKNKAQLYKVPGLGSIPILSPLFRSAEFQRNETELVIAVTPYIATPSTGDAIRMPGEGRDTVSPLAAIFIGKLENKKVSEQKGGVEGSVGYLID